MMWERFRKNTRQFRGYRGFDTVDRISIAVMAVGLVLFVAGLLIDADGTAGIGFLFFILGMLTLARDLPGGP